jgi:O-antigen/teichoic acid export membrane protein
MSDQTPAKSLDYRLDQVKQMAFSRTSRNSFIIFGGNFISALFSVVAVIFVSRTLGPTNFGILAVYSSVVTTLLGLTDFGLGTTAIKFISSHIDTDKHKAFVAMKVIFKLEVIAGILIGVIGLMFSGPIANLLGGPHLLLAIRLAFVASIFASAGAFIAPFLVAYQRFFTNAIVSTSGAVMKLIGVVILLKASQLQLNSVLLLYTTITILGFMLGLALVPKDFTEETKPGEQKKALGQIFHFSKWILLSYFATVAAGQLDVFLLLRLKGPRPVGLYAAAMQLASIMPIFIGAITTVLLPQVSKLRGRHQLMNYIKKVSFGATLLVIALTPVLLLGGILINLIFGSRYTESIGTFRILFATFFFSLYVNPITLVLYALDAPKVLTVLNYCGLIVTLILNFALIPTLGVTGAALTFFLTNLLVFIVIIPYTIRRVQRLED